jgi:hypothetical protein
MFDLPFYVLPHYEKPYDDHVGNLRCLGTVDAIWYVHTN